MKIIFLFIVVIAMALPGAVSAGTCTSAGYCGNQKIKSLHVEGGRVWLIVEDEITQSCTSWGRAFRLDLYDSNGEADEGAKAEYAALLSYVGQRKKVNIWFTPAAAEKQGLDHLNGCGGNDMAHIKGVSASFKVSEYPADELDQDDAGNNPP